MSSTEYTLIEAEPDRDRHSLFWPWWLFELIESVLELIKKWLNPLHITTFTTRSENQPLPHLTPKTTRQHPKVPDCSLNDSSDSLEQILNVCGSRGTSEDWTSMTKAKKKSLQTVKELRSPPPTSTPKSVSHRDEGNSIKSTLRENTARSLKNLIDKLGSSNSSGENKTPSEANSVKNPEPKKSASKVNLRNCSSRLVKDVVRKLGLRETVDITRDWDVYWTASSISVVRCKTFTKYQRANHFPESSKPLLKNNLAKYLTKMSLKFPKAYNFFPSTWCLPEEERNLMDYLRQYPNDWFIVKPYNCSSGHGIFITRDKKELMNCGRMVCQVYIQRPLLMDGFKFDLRIYVLVTSCMPLRIFVYNEGFARFATEKYHVPNRRNEKHRRMHLTNYSVNKNSPNCVIDDAKGTLRKLSSFIGWLTEQQIDVKTITDSMDDVIIKTTISVTPVLTHYYRMSFPEQTESNSCFQIFGFDVMFDENFHPFVLEVNTDPSLFADIRMERELKEELIIDTFNILNLTKKTKITWLNRPKAQGDKIDDKKMTLSRIEWENSHMGNYRKVYPNDNMAYYEEFLKGAQHVFMYI